MPSMPSAMVFPFVFNPTTDHDVRVVRQDMTAMIEPAEDDPGDWVVAQLLTLGTNSRDGLEWTDVPDMGTVWEPLHEAMLQHLIAHHEDEIDAKWAEHVASQMETV